MTHSLIQSLSAQFELSESERLAMAQGVAAYSNPTLGTTCFNGMRSLVGASQWQYCTSLLQRGAIKMLSEPGRQNQQVLEQMALRVAEFLMRFMVTEKNGPSSNGLESALIREDPVDQLPLEEVVERASLGNGMTLPLLSVEQLRLKLTQAYEAFRADIDLLHTRQERAIAFAGLVNRPPATSPNLQKQIETAEKFAREFFERGYRTNSMYSARHLTNVLRQFRAQHAELRSEIQKK